MRLGKERNIETGFAARQADRERLQRMSELAWMAGELRDVTRHLHQGGLRLRRENLSDAEAARLHELTVKATSRGRDEETEKGVTAGFRLDRLTEKERGQWERLAATAAGQPESFFEDRRREAAALGELHRLAVEERKPPRRMQAAPEGSITLPQAWLMSLEPHVLGLLAMMLAAFEAGELPRGAHPGDVRFVNDETIELDPRHGNPFADSAEVYTRLVYYDDGTSRPAWKDALAELAGLRVVRGGVEAPVFELELGRTVWTLRFHRAAYDALTGATRRKR